MENAKLEYGNLRWFEYRQNNSGGSFVSNDEVSHFVFIQAESTDAANKKAEEVGIYFDGCDKGWDCDCCGDRWYPSHGHEDSFVTYQYGREPETHDNVRDYAQATANDDFWSKYGRPAVIVYFADDTVERFYNVNRTVH